MECRPGRNGVAQGDAGVWGIGRRVDDDEADAFAARSMHAFDQGASLVALEVSSVPWPLRRRASARLMSASVVTPIVLGFWCRAGSGSDRG